MGWESGQALTLSEIAGANHHGDYLGNMAELDLGKIKFTWQGTWTGGSSYEKDDIVYRDGSAWIAINSSTNVQPSTANNAYWEKIAQGSDLGSLSGLAAGDLIYYDGSDFVRLPAGNAYETLTHRGSAPIFKPQGLIQQRWAKVRVLQRVELRTSFS